jgi:anti-sigma factor RsiW
MNCTDVCHRLPELLYGDLKPAEVAAVEHHLTACPACRRERHELERVRQALTAVPVPDIQVDLPLLYQQAAEREARRARRWRRAAAALAAAAALLLLALGLRLEVRLEGRRLVLSWGGAAEKADPAPEERKAPKAVAVRPKARPGSDIEERLRLLNDLVHALAADVEERDARQRQDLAQVQDQLEGLRRQASRQWTQTERSVAALYAAHLILARKGESP